MKQSSFVLLASLASTSALAQTVNFDTDAVGAVPAGWTGGVTGRGSPRWAVAADAKRLTRPTLAEETFHEVDHP